MVSSSRKSHDVCRWLGRGGSTFRGLLPFGLLASLMAGCAGYQVGQQALYRPDIQSVHVPIFESNSFRRYLGQRLSEAVAREIELKTPYRIATAERADSVLRGRILMERKRTIGEDRYDYPRLIEYDTVVTVDWIGPQGELLANTVSVPINSIDLRIGGSEQFIPEAGQSVASVQQDVIEQLAEQIVSQMEIAPY